MRLRPKHHRARGRGFTVVELLVAVGLSSIVLLAVYFVFIANARQYYTQEQIVQMQETMRFALEFLKNDLRNSGRLSLVNGAVGAGRDPGYCRPAAGPMALRLADNDANAPAILTAAPNTLQPDRLEILTDATGGTLLVTERVMGNQVRIAPAAQQITREAREVLASEPRFTGVYRVGTWLRVERTDKVEFDLLPITGVNYNAGAPVITLETNVCLGAGGCDGSCLANAVNTVEYRIQADPLSADGRKTDLVRRVLSATNGAAVSTLTIAEHVVNLQLWGTYDTRAAGAQQPEIQADPDPTDDRGNWPGAVSEAAAMNVRPERLRSLHVLLATRTPREDPEFGTAPDRASNVRLPADRTWFELGAGGPAGEPPSYARVTTLSAEVETPNLLRSF